MAEYTVTLEDMELWILEQLKDRVTNVTFSGDKHAI